MFPLFRREINVLACETILTDGSLLCMAKVYRNITGYVRVHKQRKRLLVTSATYVSEVGN